MAAIARFGIQSGPTLQARADRGKIYCRPQPVVAQRRLIFYEADIGGLALRANRRSTANSQGADRCRKL